LAATTSKEKPATNLDKYIPPDLAAKLEIARGQGEKAGERRVITILFCDVKGSTAAAEQLDPEEWTEIMNAAFEHMIQPIYKYEGTVVRLMGDAILAFFGAPLTHEDDPQRAALAALDIQSHMKPFSEDIQSRYGVGFNFRVGINTGLVVVGEVGSDLRMEYTALGDAVNLAARMEQTAVPGTIQISDETYKLIAPFFETEPLGEIEVKGKSAPVKTWRVLAARTGGQLRGLEGLTSPLVGREPELALLNGRLQALGEGQGGFVAVMGEAGLGKSTLVAAAHVEGGFNWLTGSALSYAHAVSYFAWRQIIRQSIGAQENDSPADVRSKFSEVCECCALPGGDRPFLEAILAVESEASLQVVMGYQGDALIQRVTEATRGYFCGLAAEQPLVLFFDDLHWADDASLHLLLNLVELTAENPILFLCTLRPDETAASRETINGIREKLGGRFEQIQLAPLPNDQTDTLVANLLGMTDLPANIRSLILEKAEGNPFFVEEVIRSLIETKHLVRENSHWRASGELTGVTLPNTLAGVLSARIDRLPEQARQVLQTAAVIGRTFDQRVLERLDESGPNPSTKLRTSLDEPVEQLQQAGLIQVLETGGEAQFIFRHALIQDAAYNSILIKRRRALHRRIGEVLEQLFPERLEELAPLLAHHFYTANDPRALPYSIQAAETAARLYANAEAATHYSHALETAKRAPQGGQKDQVAQLYISLGHVLELDGHYEQALANYIEMEAFAREQGDILIEMDSLTARSIMYSIFTRLHNPGLAEEMLVRALALARQTGDPAIQAKLHWNLMLHYLFSRRVAKAVEHGEQALPLARASGEQEQLAFVLNDLTRVYACTGDFEKGYAVVREARELWRALDNQSMLADNFGAEAELCFNAGEYAKTLEFVGESLRISQTIGNLWGQAYNHMLMGYVYLDRGEADRAIPVMQNAIRFGDEAGLMPSIIGERAELGLVYGRFGEMQKGLAQVEQALAISIEKLPGWKALPVAMQVRLHLLNNDLEAATQAASQAIIESITVPYPRYTVLIEMANVELALAKHDYAGALSTCQAVLAQIPAPIRPDVPEVFWRKGEALLGLGQIDQAIEALRKARSRAEALESRPVLWRILARLAEVEAQRGNRDEAEALREQARQVITFIAERLEPVGMKETFLQRPEVQTLIDSPKNANI
jgi:class 3 adenylate cyclase/tetratricopeptide (TPR) repeat protein